MLSVYQKLMLLGVDARVASKKIRLENVFLNVWAQLADKILNVLFHKRDLFVFAMKA
jgi:hypothetical protein